jgi:hypothetical protein
MLITSYRHLTQDKKIEEFEDFDVENGVEKEQ